MEEQIYELEIELLQPNPLQPRGLISPDSLSELGESIKAHGVLEPLVVAKTPAGYQIIAGERRWRASKLVGLPKVPVIIRETNPQGMLEMAIVENVQRIDLNPLERAQAYKRLMEEFGLTNEGHARALAALEDPRLIIDAYKEVLKRNLSVRGTEELVRRFRARQSVGPKKMAITETMHIVSEELDKVANDLSDIISQRADKASVKCVQTGQKVRMEFLINGHPDKTTPILQDIYQAIMGYFKLKEA